VGTPQKTRWRRMGEGEWRMENGEWRMENGGRRSEVGGRRTEVLGLGGEESLAEGVFGADEGDHFLVVFVAVDEIQVVCIDDQNAHVLLLS